MANTQECIQNQVFQKVAELVALLAQAGGIEPPTPEMKGHRRGQMQLAAACEYLDIGETKFRELITAGEIPPPYESGGRNHWSVEALDEYRKRAEAKGRSTWPQEPPAPTARSGSSSNATASATRSASRRSPRRKGGTSKGGSSD